MHMFGFGPRKLCSLKGMLELINTRGAEVATKTIKFVSTNPHIFGRKHSAKLHSYIKEMHEPNEQIIPEVCREKRVQPGIEPGTSPTLKGNHATRPLDLDA
jgi:hypothetical protein